MIYHDLHRKKILWMGIVVAVVLLSFIVVATLFTFESTMSSGAFTGKIVGKEFTPEPAQEITIGRGGLASQRVEGEYMLKVQTPDGSKIFNVWVDKTEYDEFNIGDDYYVVPLR